MNSTRKIKWQDLERLVRKVAEAKFSATARAEDISGVKCDCVLHLDDGSVILIEISRQTLITKLREDLAKFNVLRPFFFSKNIFPKCFFITLGQPRPALIESGKTNFVQVYSIEQFLNTMLGINDYVHFRQKLPFGSAIDLYSGEPDQTKYVQVEYFTEGGKPYDAERIAAELIRGRTIVLIGDYGSGKSRCIKEIFSILVETRDTHYQSPIAINLRDNWGLRRASEIITRHFTDMGLGTHVADTLKVAFSPGTIYLLDGFDEIGAQTWSDDPTKLVEIRKQSLVGIKDLVNQAAGGVIVTGREHYFNNDAELVTCLGLESKNPLLLRCNQELTDHQFSEMLGQETKALPSWVPKKPLIAAIIREIETHLLHKILETSSGQVDFWNVLMDTLCEREAKISTVLDPLIIRSLYAHIGRLSRTTSSTLGPISIKQINNAFEKTTGRPPTDESAIILQRLPGLSRIGAESLDRQFVDTYILDGLKAEDVLDLYAQNGGDQLNESWVNPVESFGSFFVAARIQSTNQVTAVVAFLKRLSHSAHNRVLISDLLSALFLCDGYEVDLAGLKFEDGRFYHVSLAEARVSGLHLLDCSFDFLDLTDAQPINFTIADSVIIRLSGVASDDHLPSWVTNCLVENFQSLGTLVQIREAGLTIAQTFLLSSLRKLFLQPGGGRKASSMYKGYGDAVTKRICEKVIALLVREGFCDKYKGDSESLYVPKRSRTQRVRGIMSQLTMSTDELWTRVSRIT